MEHDTPIRLLLSGCLVGQMVRFDGQHKKAGWLLDLLGGTPPLATIETVCPEVAVGLPVPRPSLRLVAPERGAPAQLIVKDSGEDLTERMQTWARQAAERYAGHALDGAILKRDSPSCGVHRVKVYPARGGAPARTGRGLFAAALAERLPLLPIEEEGRLLDARLREHFFERVFAHARLRRHFGGDWSAGSLVAFHSREKYLLMSHSPVQYKALGRLVARQADLTRDELAQRYRTGFLEALREPASRGRQINALQHIAGYFKRDLNAAEKTHLDETLSGFREGLVPLAVPVTLLRGFLARWPDAYLSSQSYLQPAPRSLALRSRL